MSSDKSTVEANRDARSVTDAGQVATAETKTLVVLLGPPAVGKMTVGRELSRLTGLPLFHNHLSIEAVLPVFEFGEPAFNRLVTMLRRELLREVARSELPGVIFTYVWAFNAPGELAYVQDLVNVFESEGGRVVFAEMWADFATRLLRNESADRLAAKASKRDVAASRARLLEDEKRWQFRSEGKFPFSAHLFLDTSNMEPIEAAERIRAHFHLSTGSP